MAYIYRIWNDINNKDYIGKTTNTIEERWREHKKDMNKRICENRPLYAAMRKYRVEHFYIEMIEECSIAELNDREIYWIDYYGSFKNGYNATRGGDGKCYADIEAIVSLWYEGKNLKEIHNITGHDRKTINKHLQDHGVTTEQIKKRGYNYHRNSVAMLDKNTGEILKVFETTYEISDYLKKSMSSRHVSEVCNGQRKTAYGYKWKYVKDIPGYEVKFK